MKRSGTPISKPPRRSRRNIRVSIRNSEGSTSNDRRVAALHLRRRPAFFEDSPESPEGEQRGSACPDPQFCGPDSEDEGIEDQPMESHVQAVNEPTNRQGNVAAGSGVPSSGEQESETAERQSEDVGEQSLTQRDQPSATVTGATTQRGEPMIVSGVSSRGEQQLAAAERGSEDVDQQSVTLRSQPKIAVVAPTSRRDDTVAVSGNSSSGEQQPDTAERGSVDDGQRSLTLRSRPNIAAAAAGTGPTTRRGEPMTVRGVSSCGQQQPGIVEREGGGRRTLTLRGRHIVAVKRPTTRRSSAMTASAVSARQDQQPGTAERGSEDAGQRSRTLRRRPNVAVTRRSTRRGNVSSGNGASSRGQQHRSADPGSEETCQRLLRSRPSVPGVSNKTGPTTRRGVAVIVSGVSSPGEEQSGAAERESEDVEQGSLTSPNPNVAEPTTRRGDAMIVTHVSSPGEQQSGAAERESEDVEQGTLTSPNPNVAESTTQRGDVMTVSGVSSCGEQQPGTAERESEDVGQLSPHDRPDETEAEQSNRQEKLSPENLPGISEHQDQEPKTTVATDSTAK